MYYDSHYPLISRIAQSKSKEGHDDEDQLASEAEGDMNDMPLTERIRNLQRTIDDRFVCRRSTGQWFLVCFVSSKDISMHLFDCFSMF